MHIGCELLSSNWWFLASNWYILCSILCSILLCYTRETVHQIFNNCISLPGSLKVNFTICARKARPRSRMRMTTAVFVYAAGSPWGVCSSRATTAQSASIVYAPTAKWRYPVEPDGCVLCAINLCKFFVVVCANPMMWRRKWCGRAVQEPWIQTLVFLISRVWVQIPSRDTCVLKQDTITIASSFGWDVKPLVPCVV